MDSVKKRILAISGALILFVGAVICCVFPRNNDTVASAQVFDESSRSFVIPLVTYNGIHEWDNSAPLPAVAIVSSKSLTICKSKDGITYDDSSLSNAYIIPMGGVASYSMPFINTVNNTYFDKDILISAYSASFNEIPDNYYPSKLSCHYFFYELADGPYLYCDYYVEFADVNNASNTIVGAGFSLRLKSRDWWLQSNFYNNGNYEVIPAQQNNVYVTTDVVGWSYYSISSLVGGYSRGYDEGKALGDALGFARGYAKGVAEAGGNSFTGLISAVIDVPINAFRSLFNFDLLGFNMANFMMSLLTLGGVLAVIRLIL